MFGKRIAIDTKQTIVAENEEAARHIHPENSPEDPVEGYGYNPKTGRYDKPWYESDCIWNWTKPENVNVTLVGTTDLFPEGTVLCASYNAG